MASNLADRKLRFFAGLIDLMLVYGLTRYFWERFSRFIFWKLGLDGSLLTFAGDVVPLIYLVIILIVQSVHLHKRGQSIGKIATKIKIVKLSNGKNGGIVTNFILRAVIPAVIIFIPYIGLAFALIDILFIFRDDQRCIHDLIAGTAVVKA